jgi:imidazolonepropionase-like amidohydrolase
VRGPAKLAAAVLLAWAAPVAAQGEGGAEEPSLALVGATVHTVRGDPLVGATVLVKGRTILAVRAEGGAPEGVPKVDLTGQHLYPGLIDANSVLGLVEIGSVPGTVDDAEVGRLNPNLRAELGVNPDSELLPVARTGGVLYSLTRPRRGLVCGTSALITLSGWTYEDMTVAAPVFLHVRWPSMRVDRRSETSVEEQVEAREAALEALRGAFREARAYARARAVGPGLDRDAKWEAMGPVIRGQVPVAVDADDLTQIEAALDWGERERVRLVLLGGADAWRAASKLAEANVPVILGPVFRRPRRDYEPLHAPFELAGKLHAAGVPIAFSTGASGFAAANARNLRDQAAQAVAYGLPAPAAVEALTLGAARILGVDGRLGSLEAGKLATLISVDRPMFVRGARVTRAWVAGEEVSLVDRHRRLYERYRRR